MGVIKRLGARKPLKEIESDADVSGYKKSLGVWDLLSIGVGGIIGAGIFVLMGKAAKNNAGPGVVISFIIAGFVSLLASLCYAELASTLPVSGSAYSFSYASLGELVAWIIGWDLMLEYLVGSATVAVGWSAYLCVLQEAINDITGWTYVFDPRFTNAPVIWLESTDMYPWNSESVPHAGFYVNQVPDEFGNFITPVANVPALLMVLFCTSLLVFGIKESVMVNNLIVCVKLLIVIIVIFSGIHYINPENYTPFIPQNTGKWGEYGVSGVVVAAVSVFFAFIGFDSVTTVAQESKNPKRDLPIGIIGSLLISTILYIAVSVILTGMVKYTDIDSSAGIGAAFIMVGNSHLANLISLGAIAGLTSVLLNGMIGQPRIFQAMAADGLLPSAFQKLHPNFGTPYLATLFSGVICAALAAVLPVDVLGNLTSVGTLFAFFLVSLSVPVLRFTDPELPRAFQIPGPNWLGGYFIPGLSALCSITLIFQSTYFSIARIFVWMGIGLIIYGFFGYHNSRVGKSVYSGNITEQVESQNIEETEHLLAKNKEKMEIEQQ